MDNDKFNELQLYEINMAIKHGLSEEKIELFKNPCLDDSQMEQIRWGLEKGYPIEKIKIYADEKYTVEQMRILLLCIEKNFTDKEIEHIKATFVYKSDAYDVFEQILSSKLRT